MVKLRFVIAFTLLVSSANAGVKYWEVDTEVKGPYWFNPWGANPIKKLDLVSFGEYRLVVPASTPVGQGHTGANGVLVDSKPPSPQSAKPEPQYVPLKSVADCETYDADSKLLIAIHGSVSSPSKCTTRHIVDEYIRTGYLDTHKLVVVDYEKLSGAEEGYLFAGKGPESTIVGTAIGCVCVALHLANKIQMKNIHMIGLDEGAEIAAIASNFIKTALEKNGKDDKSSPRGAVDGPDPQRPGRITALNPFIVDPDTKNNQVYLSKIHATVVDLVCTNPDANDTERDYHYRFYITGGTPQNPPTIAGNVKLGPIFYAHSISAKIQAIEYDPATKEFVPATGKTVYFGAHLMDSQKEDVIGRTYFVPVRCAANTPDKAETPQSHYIFEISGPLVKEYILGTGKGFFAKLGWRR